MSELTDALKAITDTTPTSFNEARTKALLIAIVKAHEELRADHLALVKKVNAAATKAPSAPNAANSAAKAAAKTPPA